MDGILFLFLSFVSLCYTPLHADTIPVTSTGGNIDPGTLGAAILQAVDGDIIDCSPIAGQTIGIGAQFPAIGYNITSPGGSLTMRGSGVTLDGGNAHTVFSLAHGSATITDFIIQNGLSKGGDGGFGNTGGGGGTGGGGALYIHSGTTMTISALSLNNNQAIGGAGGAGNATGGSGGGGGGFGGGRGGFANTAGANAGSGGGGGGNNGGTTGGRDGGVGSPNTFSNFAGAGGGGEIPGIPTARAGGSVAAASTDPSHSGGSGGVGSVTDGAGAGGGAGSGGSGFHGSNAINAVSPGTGIGGAGGLGIGDDNTYGAGGGGGGGNGGGAGFGTSGGGGGFNGPGGAGGVLGGGGGASRSSAGVTHIGGNGGFGAGGGGGNTGGIDTYGIGGSGGSATNVPAGGGGGSGLGGAIFIQKNGLLIIEDAVSFSDNSTTAGIGGTATGGSNGGNGSALGTDIFVQSGGSITFQINDTLTLVNPIEGAGLLSEVTGPGVTKLGGGTLHLAGTNTYLGDTLIHAGTINLNGSVSGDVQIDAEGTLSGNATVQGSISSSGTISPGNSIGEIFTTDLTLFPTSVYVVEVNGAGQSDTITASGFAQLDGSVVVSPDDLNFTKPLTYTIISTGTGVTGTFSSLTSSVPSLMRLIYKPFTVQLTYVPLEALDLSCNARNAANCFVTLAGSDATTITDALFALNFNGMQAAFAQMSPALFSGPTEVQLLDAILVRSTYTKHLQKCGYHENRNCEDPLSLWVDGIAQWQHQGDCFGYTDTTVGATLGADYTRGDCMIGCAFSATYDQFHGNNAASAATLHSYYGGLYSRWNNDSWYLNGAAIGAFNTYNTTRCLSFGTIERRAHAQHHGSEWLAHLGLGYAVDSSRCHLTPYLNLDYVFQHEGCYTETGAGSLNLQVHKKNAMLFQGEAGISLSTSYAVCQGLFIPMLTVAYMNQTPCSSKNYCAHFVDSACTFTGRGGNYERNLFVPRVAFTYKDCDDSMSVSFYYDGQVGNKYWAQDIAFDVAFRF